VLRPPDTEAYIGSRMMRSGLQSDLIVAIIKSACLLSMTFMPMKFSLMKRLL